MSENYDPSVNITLVDRYDTVWLSQRDAALSVPINFVTTPGVSLTAACFSDNRYADDATGDCLSNLLAVGFRRFEIDLYWDEGRSVWSFCPVAIPDSISDLSTPTTVSSRSASPNFQSSNPTTSSFAISIGASPTNPVLRARQLTPGTPIDIPTSTTAASEKAASSLGDVIPSVSAIPDFSNQPTIAIGPYVCTNTINLSVLFSLFLDYIQKTQKTLEAQLIYIILNIHAAASFESPGSPAPEPSVLPRGPQLLGNQFISNLSEYIYSDSNLFSDRANLNSTWFHVNEEFQKPAEGYYGMVENDKGILTTDDGWPSEAYITFAQSRRLLVGWGTIDPQMADYNFSEDSGTIFNAGFINDVQTDVNANADGQLTSGCFFRNDTKNLESVNSSWAVATNLFEFTYPTIASADLTPLLSLTHTTTNCGISPHLNSTLLNSTAELNFQAYENFTKATIWSWAPGEPRTFPPESPTDEISSNSMFRCAISNKNLLGWVVEDCSQKRYAACRARGQPYNWTLANVQVSYSFADENCPDDYYFAAPRTALENAYLTEVMRTADRDFDGHGAWIDFNSLDIQGCWTSGGPNATCPWTPQVTQSMELTRRRILVPAIGAVLVLVLFTIWLELKCYGNRRTSRRSRRSRRRAGGVVVYEGVPS
ncbi:hypothetical protein LZ554_001661 [Drepanopeziza brunnea f. sp. 'monogermtubi']|nr:hypothetical protein LZ554_001661 [Drepanopeziza brunnea f. sp. 'monogermtubi']